MVLWWLLVDLPNILAITDCFEMWLVSIKRSFQGLLGAIKTMGIIEELMEIWPNKVCNRPGSLVCSHLEDQPGTVDKQSLSIHALVDNLAPYMLCPSSTDPSLDTLLSSNSSALHSAKASSTNTIWRNTYEGRRSLENVLFTSVRILSVQRGQLSCEGLPLLLGRLKVNCRTKGGTDWRLDGSEGCSRGRGFCLVWLAKSGPWSPLVNRFPVLNIEEINTDTCEPIDAHTLSTLDKKSLPQKPK